MSFELADLQELEVPSRDWFHRVLQAVAAVAGPLPRLSIALVDDERIARLHGRYFGAEQATDVISFPLDEGEGEVVLSVTRAAAVAGELGCVMEEELALYLVHGVLHLLGYNDLDTASRREMVAKEKEALALLDITPRDR